MTQQLYIEVVYYEKMVLIDAFFYKFWMLREEFDKYKIS